MCRKYSLVFILLALIVFTSHPSFADIASLVPEAKKEKARLLQQAKMLLGETEKKEDKAMRGSILKKFKL